MANYHTHPLSTLTTHGNGNTSAIAYPREQWRPHSLHMPRSSSPDNNPTVCRPLNRCSSLSVPKTDPGMQTTVTATSTTSTIPICERVGLPRLGWVPYPTTMTTTRIYAWMKRIPCPGITRSRYLSSVLAVNLDRSQARGGWLIMPLRCATTPRIRPRPGLQPQVRTAPHPTTSYPTNPGINPIYNLNNLQFRHLRGFRYR